MERNTTAMSDHGNAVRSGSPDFKRLEALDILPLPICLKNGTVVDVEHASDHEFTAWLKWNGIPFTGLAEWTFDSKCAVINYVLRHGIKPRLIAAPGTSFGSFSGLLSDLFTFPGTKTEEDLSGNPPDGAA